MQRLGVGAELPAVLRELGVETGPLLAGLGLSEQDLRPDSRLPFTRLLGLLHAAAEASDCDHLGVLIGLRFQMDYHGIIGQLMQSAPTLGQALEDYVTWQPGYSSGAVVYLQRSHGEVALGFGSYVRAARGVEVLYDSVVAVGTRMLRLLTGRALPPEAVHLTRAAPRRPAGHARLLGAPVLFNQNRTCILLDEATLRLPLPNADPAARRRLLPVLATHGRRAGSDWTSRVRHEIRRAMFTARPDMEGVAARLQVGPRTLRRKLLVEGAQFAALRDEISFTVARELIELTNLPMSDIAASLGFASPSVFSESFHRWSGTSPRQWRREAAVRNADPG